MSRPPAWLVAAALAVYPPHVRERYGDEIADLLDHSRRPWFDLTNVAWNATLERLGSARGAPLRPYAARMGALLSAPILFYTALFVGMPVSMILAGVLGALIGQGSVNLNGDGGLQMSSEDGPTVAAIVVVVAVIATLGALTARLWTDALRVPALPVVVPTMLVLGASATTMGVLALDTLTNLSFGNGWDPEWVAVPVSTVVWWTLLTVLVARYRSLIRRGRTIASWLVVATATVVTPVVCAAIHLLALGSDASVTFVVLRGFTPLATVCTPFAFALMRVARRQGVTAGR